MKSNFVSIGCYVRLLPTRLPVNRDCSVNLYMLVKSTRTVTWKNVSTLGLVHIWLAEGVATILCCCAKLVFMLFTNGL